MIPDPSTAPQAPRAGSGGPARDASHDPSRVGHIQCCFCTDTIAYDEYRQARCWTDPAGITVAAHVGCLTRLGEHDLRLPPDPGEPPA